MFGYKLIKISEIENLNAQLVEANETISSQEKYIDELLNRIKEQEGIIAKLSESPKVNNEQAEEKIVKKVRRKTTKKTTKKEE